MRAKTFVAVGHETANKGEAGKNLRRDTMDANLLANMELGVHSDAAPGRHTSDMVGAHYFPFSCTQSLTCSQQSPTTFPLLPRWKLPSFAVDVT